MDRSDDSVLNDTFHEVLRRRTDGRWSLVASAAGRSDAIENLCKTLSSEELDQGAMGSFLTPSLVSERVEALAAFGRHTLVNVASKWRTPAEIGDDPFWLAAWNSALRHVAAELDLKESELRSSSLADEVELIWPSSTKVSYSWDDLNERCLTHLVPYEYIRLWSIGDLMDHQIDASQVRRAPTLLLRVLRDRLQLLTNDAVLKLQERGDSLLEQDPFEAALLAEVLSTFDEKWITTWRLRFLNQLPNIQDARDVIPLSYFLLGHGWIVP